ncbi:MAG: tol-pal system protein YbgF [Pseudomonadota bacterium]
MKPTAPALLLAALLAGSALAGPAEEALAQNVELRRALAAQEERIARLEAQLQNQGLLNLLNQVEALKAEVARLRGGQDEQSFKLDSADKRVKDLFADLDGRLKELASRPVAPPPDAMRLQVAQTLVPPAPPAVAVDSEAEARAYEAAHAQVKGARYKDAVAAFQTFLKQYPSGPLAANALYWTGFSHVGLGDFKSAAAAYQKLLKDFPNSPKVPDALLSLARTQAQMEETEAAKATLDVLIAKHPQSKAADNGRKLLATLK